MVDDDKLELALEATEITARSVAERLRLMAAGDYGDRKLMSVTPWVRNIWNAAADIIEQHDCDKLH